mmetsp:Transcript_105057/g.294425  ORF Transcript_105057/g.294425 Transcript_105057/m.294425 type:complete len:268 (+) Transcript_105057:465-1268(+)
MACSRVVPSNTRPVSSEALSEVCASCSSRTACSTSTAPVAKAIVVFPEKSLQDRAMSTAVSVLSPVRTHNRMPAALTRSMVSGTPSCNLSSTAVMPTSLRPSSMRAATSAMRSSLDSSMMLRAVVYSASHISYSCVFTMRMPMTSVRRPCLEKCVRSRLQASGNFSLRRPSMTLSAPLVMHQMALLCRTMTDMRFRSEVKANSWRTVNLRSLWPGPERMISDVFPAFLRTRLRKLLPTSWATCTRATSSGDMPVKFGWPSLSCTCTE